THNLFSVSWPSDQSSLLADFTTFDRKCPLHQSAQRHNKSPCATLVAMTISGRRRRSLLSLLHIFTSSYANGIGPLGDKWQGQAACWLTDVGALLVVANVTADVVSHLPLYTHLIAAACCPSACDRVRPEAAKEYEEESA